MSYRVYALADVEPVPAAEPTTTNATNKVAFLAFFALLGVGAVLHARRRVKGGIALGRAITSQR